MSQRTLEEIIQNKQQRPMTRHEREFNKIFDDLMNTQDSNEFRF